MGKVVVLANPSRRCGVHSAAKAHALALNAEFTTEPRKVPEDAFLYIHWHPNFVWQHSEWTAALLSLKDRRKCWIVHDFAFEIPALNDEDFVAVFDERLKARKSDIVIAMAMQDPYPFVPTTEGDPDLVGLFGFYGPYKGFWKVAYYALQHRKKARFITTLHPFAPTGFAAEFEEFKSFCKRNGFECITDWLTGQELADEMGKCGFFVVPPRTGFGSSGSVTSMLATMRPVFASDSPFLGAAKQFVMPFDPSIWPTKEALEIGRKKAERAREVISPEKVFGELHAKILEELDRKEECAGCMSSA